MEIPPQKTHIKPWGNSLGLRLPKAITDQLKLGDGAEVELRLTAEGILITAPIAEESLETLIQKVTPDNLHHRKPL